MKTAELYAQTLVRAHGEKTASEFDQFFTNFVSVLKEKNHYKMLPEILVKTDMLSQEKNSDQTVLVVREESVIETLKDQLVKYAEEFGTDYTLRVDPNIVGGYILKNKTAMIDQSYRSRLLSMYHKLVA